MRMMICTTSVKGQIIKNILGFHCCKGSMYLFDDFIQPIKSIQKLHSNVVCKAIGSLISSNITQL